MTARSVAFVGALVHQFEVLLPILEEHLKDQDGQVLPHLVMADIERWAEGESMSEDVACRERLQSVLDFLERAYSTFGRDVDELIAASFLEHLPRLGENGAELRTMVGPRLAKQLSVIG